MKYWLTDETNQVFTVECSKVRVQPNGAIAFYKSYLSLNPFLVVNSSEWKMAEQAKDTDAENQDS